MMQPEGTFETQFVTTLLSRPSDDEPIGLSIYRNNYFSGLIPTLEDHFPVVAALIGPDCFRGVAARFAGQHPPASPVLERYGRSYPEFIEGQADLDGLPYLADIARLEWLLKESARTPSMPALSQDQLAAANESLLLEVHPSVQFLSSPYSVCSIWLAHGCSEETMQPIDPTTPEKVVAAKTASGAQPSLVDAGTLAWLGALKGGADLEEAVEAGLHIAHDFDLGQALGLGLIGGWFVDPEASKDCQGGFDDHL